jgi:putative cofactor-binding repeat protein
MLIRKAKASGSKARNRSSQKNLLGVLAVCAIAAWGRYRYGRSQPVVVSGYDDLVELLPYQSQTRQ